MKKDSYTLYYNQQKNDVIASVGSSGKGLSRGQARERLSQFGPNTLPKDKKTAWIILLLRQFHSPLVYIIIAAATISIIVGHVSDAVFIMVVILINAIVGFIQEFKAEKALSALKSAVVRNAVVLRSGQRVEIPVEGIVVGDVIILAAGDYIAADGRILTALDHLATNEMVLTGESTAVEKKSEVLTQENVTIGDQYNMLFAGSHIARGAGTYIVTATGHNTELGAIAQLVRDGETVSEPLQEKFAYLSRMVSIAVLIAILIFAGIGFMRGQALDEIFIMATALVVSAIPEGLLPAVTMVMVFGVRRLATHRALVRKLSATETIGAITTICTDKTGTLTEGEMRAVQGLAADGTLSAQWHTEEQSTGQERSLQKVVEIASLVNDAFREKDAEGNSTYKGRPTDVALLRSGYDQGHPPEVFLSAHEEVGRIAFSSERKFAARVFEDIEKHTREMYVIGAPEVVLARVVAYDFGGGTRVSVDDRENAPFQGELDRLTEEGYRILACAYRGDHAKDFSISSDEEVNDLVLAGFIALRDPVRTRAEEALVVARRAGIRPIIITGDHATTAQAVARSLHWDVTQEQIVVGKHLDEMSDEELRTRVQTVEIFARVAPVHKIRIVQALQANDEIVAMVGDGVNDAPALKAAHVGISMGNGTEITKSVADMVLLDSSFTTIVDAIKQGRAIFENIRRIILYLIADDFSELFVFFVAMLFGYPLPLAAAQILWINLVEDSLPNIALTTERDTKGIMDLPPRSPDEPILTRVHKRFMMAIFAISGCAAVGVFFVTMHLTEGDEKLAQTMTFILIAFDSLALTYILRSFRQSVWRTDIFSNVWINYGVLASFLLLLGALYIGPLAQMLGTVPLDVNQWSIIIGITIVEVILLEIAKKHVFRITPHS